ncbi:MAG: prolyl-tRNA synthetase associated domain-containing protein [Candidatus Aminicenantes bacterium]|nr:prolyl-tRNA synthetase associated domain-containing protein [Candidatus Aminicenantes bacterium]
MIKEKETEESPKESPENKVYQILTELGICFTRYEHPPVYTVADTRLYWASLPGARCKNLFLRDEKGKRHFLVIAEQEKPIDLKKLAQIVGEKKLSFASPERLRRFLGVDPGSVSPFGLIYDLKKEVEILIDSELEGMQTIHFHPNVNTVTIGLSLSDFKKFLNWTGHFYRFVKL